MGVAVENGKYEEPSFLQSEEKPKRKRKPRTEGTPEAGRGNKWSRTLEPEMILNPYMMGSSEGFVKGIRSDQYVFERLARIFANQLGCTKVEQAINLIHDAWDWKQSSAVREKKLDLERLKAQAQERLAQIEALEKEVGLSQKD